MVGTVAVLGLGQMGAAMASRLRGAGLTVHAYNRTAARAAALGGQGIRPFPTPALACTGVDAIIGMVADDAASRSVWCGTHGALAADLSPSAFAIECSTLSHAWVGELAGRARAAGLRYLDAPVTGLPRAAAAGELTLLVGAESSDLDAARGLLDHLANRILHFGAVGTGTAYKLIVNLLGAVQIASVAESMAIAERAGLDLRLVAEAIACGQAASPQVVRNSARMVDNDYRQPVIFTPALRLKDVSYALNLCRSLGIGAPFGALAQTCFEALCECGLAQVNESAILEIARQAPCAPTVK